MKPLRGKIAKTMRLIEVIPLTRSDLETLRLPRARTQAQRFREAHHRIAQLLAKGLSQMDVARVVGYSVTRISQLEADPSFQQLIAVYRERENERTDEIIDPVKELAEHLTMRYLRAAADNLDRAEDEGELIPLKTAIMGAGDLMDRFGYGKRQMNVNVNVDFAAQLEKARARSSKVIDMTVRKGGSSAPSPAPEASQQTPPDPCSASGVLPRRALG